MYADDCVRSLPSLVTSWETEKAASVTFVKLQRGTVTYLGEIVRTYRAFVIF